MIIFYLLILLVGTSFVAWLLFKETKRLNKRPSFLDRLNITSLEQQKAKPPAESAPIQASAPLVPLNNSLPNEFSEWQEKYEKLEQLLLEKTEELAKQAQAFKATLSAREEFEKVKTILETELKEYKEKNHSLALELSTNHNQIENYKQHTKQLEDYLKSKELVITEKDRQIDELVKRLQTFASPQEKS